MSNDKLVYHGGPIIKNALVQPIFWWGPGWNGALKATANQFTADMQQLMAGPYMLGLSQYGGIAPALPRYSGRVFGIEISERQRKGVNPFSI